MDDISKEKTLPTLTSEDMPLPCPATIGPYKIESFFSKGGMSILYLAVHPHISKPLLIKVLSPKYIRNKEMVDRFLTEAKIIGMSNHPNIIKLYDQGKWEKGLYIAMEFVQGISLRQFILQKSLSQRKALEIILQVAYALNHLHSHGVIHRDLKPENILITETGEIKVIDFGIAQLREEAEQERHTQRKAIMGTPVYMSPEQRENPSNVTYSSDIFSLGIITYELVLGRLSHGIIHISLLPRGLRKIIEKTLRLNPLERYQNIVEFITDISHYIHAHKEEPQKSDEEQMDEILNNITETQNFLFPKTSPKWQQLDIGIATTNGLSLTGIYLDFFKLQPNNYVILLAEPVNEGIQSLIYIAMLRGLVHSSIKHFDNKKNIHPISILQHVNEILANDSIKQHFHVNFLILEPDENQLLFVSCDYTPLWHAIKGHKDPSLLSTPNALLGENLHTPLVETTSNWNVGDSLIFHTSYNGSIKKENSDDLKKVISDNLIFPSKHQAKKIVEWIKIKEDVHFSKRSAAVITIRRTF